MADKHIKPGYAGKVKNTGSQIVEAVFPAEKGKTGTVKKGSDLRSKGAK